MRDVIYPWKELLSGFAHLLFGEFSHLLRFGSRPMILFVEAVNFINHLPYNGYKFLFLLSFYNNTENERERGRERER